MTDGSSAAAQAVRAAEVARIVIEPLDSMRGLERAEALFSRIWSEPGGQPTVGAHVLKALQLSGNYVAGAFATGGDLVGVSAGWASVEGEPALHSHITGVVPGHAGAGVGYALKLHQRAWCMQRGIERITWTFDPLVRRNAFFNLAKLAARAARYLENVYGSMTDAINLGDESDRLWVCWELASGRVAAATEGAPRLVAAEGLPVAVEIGEDGGPSMEAGSALNLGGGYVVRLPPDIETLRATAPEQAHFWRIAIRQALGGVLRQGSGIDVGMTAARDLVLRPGSPSNDGSS
jgi:predicted GNAT superfamily acetyltransferase